MRSLKSWVLSWPVRWIACLHTCFPLISGQAPWTPDLAARRADRSAQRVLAELQSAEVLTERNAADRCDEKAWSHSAGRSQPYIATFDQKLIDRCWFLLTGSAEFW